MAHIKVSESGKAGGRTQPESRPRNFRKCAHAQTGTKPLGRFPLHDECIPKPGLARFRLLKNYIMQILRMIPHDCYSTSKEIPALTLSRHLDSQTHQSFTTNQRTAMASEPTYVYNPVLKLFEIDASSPFSMDRDLLSLHYFAFLSRHFHPNLRGDNTENEIEYYKANLPLPSRPIRGSVVWDLIKVLLMSPYRCFCLARMDHIGMTTAYGFPAGSVTSENLSWTSNIPQPRLAICLFCCFLSTPSQALRLSREYNWTDLDTECSMFILGNREWILHQLSQVPNLECAVLSCVRLFYAGNNLPRLKFRGICIHQLLMNTGHREVCLEFSETTVPRPPTLETDVITSLFQKNCPRGKAPCDYRRVAMVRNAAIQPWLHSVCSVVSISSDSEDDEELYFSDDDEYDLLARECLDNNNISTDDSLSARPLIHRTLSETIPTTVLDCLSGDTEIDDDGDDDSCVIIDNE